MTDRHLSDRDHRAAYQDAVATLLDTFSYERAIHLIDPPNPRCLQIGAGTFAGYLAELVGPGGQVIATEPDPVLPFPNLTVIPQDIAIDEPPGSFDFVHVRLVLAQLPGRRQVLSRLVHALKPGGSILVEDWDLTRTDMVLHAPSREAIRRYTRLQSILKQLAAAGGADLAWARRIHATLLGLRLVGVETVIYAADWSGDGPGAQVLHGILAQHHSGLVRAGLTHHAIAQAHALLDDPRFVPAGHLLYSTSGRRLQTDTAPMETASSTTLPTTSST